jgi:hypothetical protein
MFPLKQDQVLVSLSTHDQLSGAGNDSNKNIAMAQSCTHAEFRMGGQAPVLELYELFRRLTVKKPFLIT